jgi:glyoxylase-like metal-dependent hydrolase (beta-lactamase superfamily II)
MKRADRPSLPKLPKGVHLIECRVGELPNRLPLIWGERPILIDSGLKDEPDEVILPALRSLGLDPARLALLVNSHADVDHNGGNAALLKHCPQVRIACAEPDRDMVESAQALWDLRWQQLEAEHGMMYPVDLKPSLGEGTHVDWVIRDGDVLALDAGRTLEAVALPGHSRGHLGFLLRPERILFSGDAVQGDGRLSPPQYLDPAVYLASLRRISRLRPSILVTCHYGLFRGAAIQRLLKASRGLVTRIDSEVRRSLRGRHGGLTLRELTYQVSRALGLWEEANDMDFAFTVNGHLARAVQRGLATEAGPERPLTYLGTRA